MKKLLPFITLFLLLFSGISCKKAIEKKQEDMVKQAIIDGIWIVEQYFEGANNISSDFLNYDFKFYDNGTVTGTLGASTTNGTWAANTSTYTITSNFPAAADPIQKMNGLWKITDSYWDYVEAEMTTPSGKNLLHLRKKP